MSRRNAFVVLLALGLVVVIAITFLVPHRSDRTRAAASVARPPTPDASVAPAEPALAVPPELVAPTLDVERAEPRVAASEPNAFAPPSIDEAAAFLRRVLPDRYGKLTREEAAALTALDLRGAQITDADLALLAGLPALAIVSLRGTAVTDAGLEHLKELTQLKHLYLWQTKTTEAGVAKLKKALPNADISTGAELKEIAKTEEKKDEKKEEKK